MIDCQYRSTCVETELAVCYAAKTDVHLELCRACLAAGEPDPCAPSRPLASAIYGGFVAGRHKDVEAAEKSRLVILQGQFADAGRDFDEWRQGAQIRPLTSPDEKTLQCIHLGAPVERRGCGCWRKQTYECTAQDKRHVTPETHCPCTQFEPV